MPRLLRHFVPLFMILFVHFSSTASNWDVAFLAGPSGSDSFESSDEDDFKLDTKSGNHAAMVVNYLQRYKGSHRLQYELYVGQTDTDLTLKDLHTLDTQRYDMNIRYYHIGGTYELSEPDRAMIPFVGASLGMSQFDAESFDTENEFSMGFSGGFKWLYKESVGVRVDGRVFATFMDTNSAIFCSGGCIGAVQSDVWWQYQITAGLMARF
ncbi:hypothetical protein [Echinimonas agarilytica]|uniref:Outer membrane protein beta-barrel domain-containing protein n=1 Tax=Echinimonas agarilytica TaxID=1215918 RepID=A0AA42B712_9GAMM|nr:hypothetical protein [Echinimonas agarilytica]MCM2679387.1 hypothetical protein [Echinimonas agarilytica]